MSEKTKKEPSEKEIKDAERLAAQVSPELLAMFNAEPIKDADKIRRKNEKIPE